MELTVRSAGEEVGRPQAVRVDNLVIAGWTGRDAAAMEAHIRELEEIGIARPARTPIYYRCAAALLTTAERIEVVGDTSSGEVEFLILSAADGLLVTVGSDHTDREVEKVGVTISKQLCAKPMSPEAWRFDDVAGHWDELVLRSWATIGGERRLYQEGPVTTMRDPRELIAGYTGGGELQPGAAMFCGTLAVRGAIEPADRFEMELDDPVLKRRLRHAYAVTTLPIEG